MKSIYSKNLNEIVGVSIYWELSRLCGRLDKHILQVLQCYSKFYAINKKNYIAWIHVE